MVITSAAANPWISVSKPNPQASLRMFCFPYAGGGASIFYKWADYLPKNVEVCPISLPGRGLRLAETPATRMSPLICSLAESLIPSLDKPFVFFGHSMGALISFELARYLRSRDRPEPSHLFVSGRNAPQLPLTDPPLYTLPESDFLEGLRSLNGTPQRVLENTDLMRLLLPCLQADFAVCETYVYTSEPPLNCSISAFGGIQDPINQEGQYSVWPADRKNALGWRDAGKIGLKSECLAYIKEVWTDMRPLSLRKKMEEAAKQKELAGHSNLKEALEATDAHVTFITAVEHDRTLALISHLPQLVSCVGCNDKEINICGCGPEDRGARLPRSDTISR